MSRLNASHLVWVLILGLTGCSMFGESEPDRRILTPSDFTPSDFTPPGTPGTPGTPGSTPAPEPAGSATTEPGSASVIENPTTAPDTLAGGSATAATLDAEVKRVLGDFPKPSITAVSPQQAGEKNNAYLVDGMVGQVNGNAIYATRVLEPIDAQLERLGKEESLPDFRQRAKALIAGTLEEIVLNALILGEAERDLSAQEREGLKWFLRERRQDLIRRWGAGSATVADANLREKRGRSLDEVLQELRMSTLVQRYRDQKFLPKINVTRKDIERYYNDRIGDYQPKPGRTIRLIQASGASDAADIQKQLDAGKTFVDVASLRLNRYRHETGGLFGQDMTGDRVFGVDLLNEAMLKLKQGEHSPQIKHQGNFFWVYVEKINTGQMRTLRDVQSEIEDLLRRQKFQKLMQRYRQQLFQTGTYNPLDEMAQTVLDIAVSRYTPGTPTVPSPAGGGGRVGAETPGISGTSPGASPATQP